ncbi:uncharacterized protein A1O9_07893 [Exophiala aquamarina CBS 119918]|uniref:BZIP domain-containing protein n=1 Tax=Exophiala aquamarina CBS 119918 TaxID=1182545 RepID=A0A072P9B1_9EURO|nr:uncharacterized protein A1O9_07893 [Exophiala aquamarina CBS 119918]KEF56312.1 hypothetical protein A1O9_07893 [Exophiala aquamarina CBS 119918]
MNPMNNQFLSVTPTQAKTPAHTLIRVRNNQRRHRERRRQYIALLEQKVHQNECLLAEARAKIAELEADSRYWRDRATKEHADAVVTPQPMLPTEEHQQLEEIGDEIRKQSLWLQDDDTYARDATAGFESQRLVAMMKTTAVAGSSSPCISSPQRTSALVPLGSVYLFQRPEPGILPQHSTQLKGTSLPALLNDVDTNQIEDVSNGPLASISNCKTYPPLGNESTVPCAHASNLIAQQNVRCLDENSIQTWLQKSFRSAQSQSEGCRVETASLFALLDFISAP